MSITFYDYQSIIVYIVYVNEGMQCSMREQSHHEALGCVACKPVREKIERSVATCVFDRV